jgi:hypothetical protein
MFETSWTAVKRYSYWNCMFRSQHRQLGIEDAHDLGN